MKDKPMKRPNCTHPGCKNKGRRIGHRQYDNKCYEHRAIYYAQESKVVNER